MASSNWFRCVAVALAAALATSAVGGCRKKVEADLVIASPHNKKIETEFDTAFREWHKQKFAAEVKIEWRDLGGTTAVTRYLIQQYKRAETSGIDLVFGGGAPDHKLLASKGITVPVKLPEEILSQLPEMIGPVRQYDPDGRWYGATFSSFGIIYSRPLLQAQSLPIPTRWDDLADPRMFGKVSAADGTQSGSARAAYEMVIQSAPDWPAGWAKLLKIFANCKHFTGGASDIPKDVADGEVLAGAAIDFYAYLQIAVSGDTVAFSRVAETTAFTPDPIAMLKGAPHPEMARRFMEFVLSEPGQTLWCLAPGVPGGPRKEALFRQPIRRDIYAKYTGKMFGQLVDPFERQWDFQLDEEAAAVRISRLLGPLMKTAAIDLQPELRKAWRAIIDAGMPEDLLAEFAALPEDLAGAQAAVKTARELSDERRRELITRNWQDFFRGKYKGIVERAGK